MAANSVNAQMNTWADQRYRTLCDALVILDAKILAWQADYVAQGIGALCTADAANNVGNGVPTDGRPLVTGLNITNFNAGITALATALHTTLIGGVGTTVKAQADIGQVSGSAR